MIPAIALLLVGLALGTIFGLWLADAPVCECGDVDCGGDCIDWGNAS